MTIIFFYSFLFIPTYNGMQKTKDSINLFGEKKKLPNGTILLGL